jgi:hypothetical protein
MSGSPPWPPTRTPAADPHPQPPPLPNPPRRHRNPHHRSRSRRTSGYRGHHHMGRRGPHRGSAGPARRSRRRVQHCPVVLLSLGAAVLALGWYPTAVGAIGALPVAGGFLLDVLAQSIDAPDWSASSRPSRTWPQYPTPHRTRQRPPHSWRPASRWSRSGSTDTPAATSTADRAAIRGSGSNRVPD